MDFLKRSNKEENNQRESFLDGFVNTSTHQVQEEDICIPFPQEDEGENGVDNSDVNSTSRAHNKLIRDATQRQLKRRRFTIGFHHGKLNPLPSTWVFPKGLSIINMMNMWYCGNPKEQVPPFRYLKGPHVSHLKNGRENISKIGRVMEFIVMFVKEEKVWIEDKNWSGAKITTIWTGIWHRLDPYLRTVTEHRSNNSNKMDISRKGQMSWRKCYNEMCKAGLFKGN